MGSVNHTAVKARKAYQQLRDAILGGSLEPGAYLRERELAEKLRVCRTPVREALRRLERDGRIQLTPHIGAAVREVSLEHLFEVLEMRRCLEPHAAYIAATRMTPEIGAKLAAFRKTFAGAVEQQPLPAIIRRLITADRSCRSLEASGLSHTDAAENL